MIIDKERRLNHIKDPQERLVLTHVLDQIGAVLKTHRSAVTDFFDPYYCFLITEIVKGLPDLAFQEDGGYAEAERRRLKFYPEYLSGSEIDAQFGFLEMKGNFDFNRVTHRDFLGAILGLGVRREKIGDVLIHQGEKCQVIVAQEIQEYLRLNLNQVHRVPVTVEEISRSSLSQPPNASKIIGIFAASLRLDAVAANGFGVSRNKFSLEITSGKVKVNWRERVDPTIPVQEGDVISVKGRGRILIKKVEGITKKGRYKLTISRFL